MELLRKLTETKTVVEDLGNGFGQLIRQRALGYTVAIGGLYGLLTAADAIVDIKYFVENTPADSEKVLPFVLAGVGGLGALLVEGLIWRAGNKVTSIDLNIDASNSSTVESNDVQ